MGAMKAASLLVAVVACSTPPASNETPADAAPGTTPDASTTEPTPDAPASASCTGRQPQPRDAVWNIDVNGVARAARVHVPASYDPTKRTPIVIDLHGRTGWASQQAGLSHSLAKSDAAGFIAIYPESATSPTSWNAGGGTSAGGCCDPAYANGVDDAGFIRELLDEAEAKLCVDTDRVYAMGLSNGGYLAYRVACELSDRIAAVGSVAGGQTLAACNPTRPVPVWHVHGTSDTLVDYSWASYSVGFWTDENGCTTSSTTYQQGDASCVTHSGCTAGADVVLCTIDQGGHQWPGGEALPFMGKKSDHLIATDALWEFFVAHPRPGVSP